MAGLAYYPYTQYGWTAAPPAWAQGYAILYIPCYHI